MPNNRVSRVSRSPLKLAKQVVILILFAIFRFEFREFRELSPKLEKKMNDFNLFRSFGIATPKGVFSGRETGQRNPLGRGRKIPP